MAPVAQIDIETVAPALTADSAAPRVALADGGPLAVPPDAPQTLTEAFLKTAAFSGETPLHFVSGPDEEVRLTYRLLLDHARRILSGLRASGLAPGNRVILQLDDLPTHFAAFWACVLGGITPVTVAVAGSYKDRNGVVNKLCNTWKLLDHPAIICSAHLVEPICGLAQILDMPEIRALAAERLQEHAPATEIHPSQPEDLVFFQLTSGSTGIPKCIQETHRGIVSHIHGSQQFNGYRPSDITLNWLPVDHVVPILTFHLKDVYLGCTQIHVKTSAILAEPLLWLDLMDRYQVTHTWAPNFGFKLVTDRLAQSPARAWNLSALQFLMNAGEQVTVPVLRAFLDAVRPFGVRAEAMQPAFGMAEACTCMTYQNQFDFETGLHRFHKSSLSSRLVPAASEDPNGISFVDLGPPMPGVQIRITDSQNHLLPEGVIGRFQIKGRVITPGYLNNEPANRDAFVGDEWFNSGDLGFILNGRLTLTGREKEMIIVRGANFYCYEIEDVVNQVPGVEATFSAACAVENADAGSEDLAVLFVPKDSDPASHPQLVREIKRRVAASLGVNPAFVVPLPKADFPKTTSGKIQRTQMKKAFQAGTYEPILQRLKMAGGTTAAPQTAVERQIAQIWTDVLGPIDLSRDTSFFEVGDSLRAAQVVSRLREKFRVPFDLATLFESASTIAAIAHWIESADRSRPAPTRLQRRPSHGPAPLSPSQEQIWLLEQLHGNGGLYNVPIGIWLRGPLSVSALRRAFAELLQRHECLRSSYGIIDGALVQAVDPRTALDVPLIDLSHAPDTDRSNLAWERATGDAQARFDLGSAPVLRANLYQLGPDEHLLGVTVHQVATDIWSLRLLVQELAAHYEAALAHRHADLPALPIQFSDFAVWQREQLAPADVSRHLDFWRQRFPSPPPLLELPVDAPVPATRSFVGATLLEKLSSEWLQPVKTLARSAGATPFMALLAAYVAWLHRISRQTDIVVGTAAGGRQQLETEALLGFFVNSVPLRTDLSGNPTFRSLIERVRQTVLTAYAHQGLPFHELVQKLQLGNDPNQHPLFRVWFALNDPLPQIRSGALDWSPARIVLPVAQFDLTIFLTDYSTHMTAELEYATELFQPSTARALLADFILLLRTVALHPDLPLDQLPVPQRAARRRLQVLPLEQIKRHAVKAA